MDTLSLADVLAFDLDTPPSEYSFSTRLATENKWTKNFTKKAIAEYKKFMYLAANSEAMVSPSEIVDIVWHQHLLFSQSYSEFCRLLGKNIQHVPSTHSREDFQKFAQARDRTSRLYNSTFGEQPPDIWNSPTMLSALPLRPARVSPVFMTILAVASLIVLLVPFCYIAYPIYIHFNNPYFTIGYILLAVAYFRGFTIYNKTVLTTAFNSWPDFLFIKNLKPSELVYLQNQRTKHVIHDIVNGLIADGHIRIDDDKFLSLQNEVTDQSVERQTVASHLSYLGSARYPELLRKLSSIPLFSNNANSLDSFRHYFNRSTLFLSLFAKNLFAGICLLLFGYARILIGLYRDKPVQIIVFAGILLTIGVVHFLRRLQLLLCTDIIPNSYRHQLLEERADKDLPEWEYFLYGNAVLAAGFLPVLQRMENNSSFSAGGDSACGSSCGSSCGSGGCGGCGGGD